LVVLFLSLMLRRPASALFPTRRSSDLGNFFLCRTTKRTNKRSRLRALRSRQAATTPVSSVATICPASKERTRSRRWYCAGHYGQDRKSTRLNSSHVKISYAVFCLKKKI